MSKFFSEKFAKLTPYTPGEQPKDMRYIKLNTNESPFPPPKAVVKRVEAEAKKAELYSDPTCAEFLTTVADKFGVNPNQVIATNGSDEVLNFAFMAFCDKDTPVVFPDITYGFYPVFAKLHNIPYKEIPLKEDFSIDYKDYLGVNSTVVIANPNAPTGLYLKRGEIEEIVKSNPDNIVIIDEAYVDFGAESSVPLIKKYDNLLVTQTFSKSRSLAGARLGVGFANENLIADLHTIRYSTNPYNVNRMTLGAGVEAIKQDRYYRDKIREICRVRYQTKRALEKLGFEVLDSGANFLFAKTSVVDGETLYKKLKKKGVLVRHFTLERIKDFNRITIGTEKQMQIFLQKVEEIIKE